MSYFSESDGFISHPLVEENTVEYREYQKQISERGSEESTLVALPTGTGKTIIAVLVAAQRSHSTNQPILFLAPNKPLVDQQYESFKELLSVDEGEFLRVTGEINPDDREEIWNELESEFVFATPEVIENDIISGTLDISQFGLITFDECHKVSGEYAYTFIAEQYRESDSGTQHTLGLSASPGSSKKDILQICKKLDIRNVEIMGEDNELIQEYLYTPDIEKEWVQLDDEILEMRSLLEETAQECYRELEDYGYLDSHAKNLSIRKLKAAKGKIRKDMSNDDSKAYSAISVHAEAMKLNHAIKLIDTQGVQPLETYLEKQADQAESGDSKAVKRMMDRSNVQEVFKKAREYSNIHPKKTVLRMYLIDTVSSGGQMILFTEYLDTADSLVEFINSHSNITAKKFTGQSQMTQKEQQEVLTEFKNNEFDVLVSTSVGEEGLDIPDASIVVFYEPVPKGIRSVQRRGRTARETEGKVVIMIGKGTRDEGYYFAAQNQEDKMESNLSELADSEDSIQDQIHDEIGEENEDGQNEQDGQYSIEDFNEISDGVEDQDSDNTNELDATAPKISENTDGDIVKVIADSRELKSSVVQKLFSNEDIDLETETLKVGDFVVGPETVIERKETSDLVNTITGDRSLFEQVQNMVNSYDRAILLIEGEQSELYSHGVHPNAIKGILDSVTNQFNVDVFYTTGEKDTAEWIHSLAKRAQDDSSSTVSAHGKKKTTTLTDQQEYIVSSIEGIGPVSAQDLLKSFGTVRRVFNANEDELKEVDGIGPKTAKKIYSTLSSEYKDE